MWNWPAGMAMGDGKWARRRKAGPVSPAGLAAIKRDYCNPVQRATDGSAEAHFHCPSRRWHSVLA